MSIGKYCIVYSSSENSNFFNRPNDMNHLKKNPPKTKKDWFFWNFKKSCLLTPSSRVANPPYYRLTIYPNKEVQNKVKSNKVNISWVAIQHPPFFVNNCIIFRKRFTDNSQEALSKTKGSMEHRIYIVQKEMAVFNQDFSTLMRQFTMYIEMFSVSKHT